MNFERNLSPKATASDYIKLIIMYAALKKELINDDDCPLPMPIELMSEHDVRKWWAENFEWIKDAIEGFRVTGLYVPQLEKYKMNFPTPYGKNINAIYREPRAIRRVHTIESNKAVSWIEWGGNVYTSHLPFEEQENPFWEERGGAMFMTFSHKIMHVPIIDFDMETTE
jgi:hypothetical protein